MCPCYITLARKCGYDTWSSYTGVDTPTAEYRALVHTAKIDIDTEVERGGRIQAQSTSEFTALQSGPRLLPVLAGAHTANFQDHRLRWRRNEVHPGAKEEGCRSVGNPAQAAGRRMKSAPGNSYMRATRWCSTPATATSTWRARILVSENLQCRARSLPIAPNITCGFIRPKTTRWWPPASP